VDDAVGNPFTVEVGEGIDEVEILGLRRRGEGGREGGRAG